MPRTKNSRNANGRSTIYLGSDGYWHGRVTVGAKEDGTADRRHVKRKNHDDVVSAVTALETARSKETVPKKGRSPLARDWLTEWVENIAGPNVRFKTLEAYRNSVYRHMIPAFGSARMAKLAREPKQFERLYADMTAAGYRPLTVHQVHRTARTAFREAVRREVITKNPFETVKGPRVDEEEIEPFDIDEVRALIACALTRRNGVRYVMALALGTRKGESLGLRWSQLDERTRVLRIRKQRQRQTYQHGCSDPVRCAAKHHKVKPCKSTCERHKRCPPPCPVDCRGHAMHCAARIGGVVEVDVKSRAGRRGMRLPDPLFEILMDHKAAQAEEREHAGTEWRGGDWMFTQPNGLPVDPRTDHDEWKALLVAAGVREARLHDARHTAATVLLLLGVQARAAMDLMGWSNTAMAKRYQHVTAALRDDIAAQLGGLLWGK